MQPRVLGSALLDEHLKEVEEGAGNLRMPHMLHNPLVQMSAVVPLGMPMPHSVEVEEAGNWHRVEPWEEG